MLLVDVGFPSFSIGFGSGAWCKESLIENPQGFRLPFPYEGDCFLYMCDLLPPVLGNLLSEKRAHIALAFGFEDRVMYF